MTSERAMASLREDLAHRELEKLNNNNLALYANNPKNSRRDVTVLETREGYIYCGKKYHQENQC
jgi:hypothetical protein